MDLTPICSWKCKIKLLQLIAAQYFDLSHILSSALRSITKSVFLYHDDSVRMEDFSRNFYKALYGKCRRIQSFQSGTQNNNNSLSVHLYCPGNISSICLLASFNSCKVLHCLVTHYMHFQYYSKAIFLKGN